MKTLVDEKLGKRVLKLIPKLPKDKVAQIRLKEGSRFGYKASFSMILPGNFKVFAETKAKTFMEAVSDLWEKVERQIKQFKEKRAVS